MNEPVGRIKIDADLSPFRRGLAAALSDTAAFGSGARARLEGVGPAVENLRGRLMSLSAVLGGGALVAVLRNVVNLQDEMSKAAQKAGVTTEQFTSMNYAAKLADVSTEELGKTYTKLSGILTDAQAGGKEAGKMLKDLGVDPAKLQNADDLLLALADRFSSTADGAEKTSLAVKYFGERLGPGLIPFLNQGRGGIEQLRQEAERLGVVISTEAGKASEELNDNLTRLGQAGTGVFNVIAQQLVPSLVDASTFFVKATKDAGLFHGTLISIGALFAKGLGLDERGQLEGRMSGLRGEAERLKGLLIGVDNTLQSSPGNEMAQRRHATLTLRLQELNKEIRNTEQSLISLNAGGSSAGAGRGVINPPVVAFPNAGGGSSGKTSPGGRSGADKPGLVGPVESDASLMAFYENWLAQDKRVQFELSAGRDYTREQELTFWRDVMASVNLSASDRLTIERRVAGLVVETKRQEQQQLAALDQARAAGMDEKMMLEIEAAEQVAQQRYQKGEISLAELHALELRYESMRFKVQSDALRERLEMLKLDPSAEPAELQRRQDQLIQLEMQHQMRRRQLLAGGAGPEGQGAGMAASMLGSTATWENLFNGILNNAMTWRQQLGGIVTGAGQAMIQELVTKPAAAWVAGLARMLLIKMGFLAADKGADVAASGAKVALKTSEAGVVVGANAAEAGSGAASALADIPVIGPALALAAMVAIVSKVSSLKSGIKSASGGYDIPRGLNPMVQAHEEEMILPSPLANAVRRMAGEGGAAGAGGAAAPAPRLNATPLPGGFWVAQEKEFVRFFKSLERDNAFR